MRRAADHAEVVVLCERVDQSISGDIRQIPIFCRPIAYLSQPLWVLRDAWRIRRAVRREVRSAGQQPVVIHATLEAYAMFTPFLRGLGARLLMTTHGTYSVLPLLSWRTRWLYQWMYRSLHRVVAVSTYTKRHILKHAPGLLSPEKIMVLLNGVDFRERPKHRDLGDGIFRIITVGEVKHRKGGHHLVRIAHVLREKHRFPFDIIFIGNVNNDSVYVRGLQQFIRDHQLEDCVHFAGKVSQEQLDEYYQTADLFVLLSVHEGGHYEGYPLVFHEAAMWGLPTIGTYDCGAEDAIRHGVTGMLVHPEAHEEVADVLAKMRSGQIAIHPAACVQWAKENDWGNKNIMSMYLFDR